MSDTSRPPRLAEAVLVAALRPGVRREDIVGSLAQEFQERSLDSGRSSALWWYRRQVAGLVVREAFARMTANGEGDGILSSLAQDLRFAARAVMRTPGPYVVALATVALGVGANSAMFSVVRGVVLAPLPYPNAERLVSVWPEKRWSVQMLQDVRARTDAFGQLGVALRGSLALVETEEPTVISTWRVSGDWFEVLGATPAVGRLLRDSDEIAADGPVIVLSHGFWLREFGADDGIVGRSIALSGDDVERRTVVGVLEEDFAPFPGDADAWAPLIRDPEVLGFQGVYGGTAIGTLRPGVSHEQAIEEMRAVIPELRNVHSTQFREVRHSPVDVVPLLESVVRDVRSRLFTLLGAVGLVLLVACTNVANVLLARGNQRRREVGLRLALGASRGRILRQMVTESVAVGLTGGMAGLGVALFATPLIRDRVSAFVPRSELISLDAGVVAYAIAISFAAALVFGAVPAIRSAGQDPGSVLGENGRASIGGRRSGRLNDALIVCEVGLSLVLVVSAGLMLKSLHTLTEVDPGFDTEGVVALNVVTPSGRYDEEEARGQLYDQLISRLEALPGVGVGRVAAVNSLPLSGGWAGTAYQVRGQEVLPGESIVGGVRIVSRSYFDVLGIIGVDGRLFDARDSGESETVALVNETFVARHWPAQSPIGEPLLDGEGEEMATVVGVVRDTRFAALDEPPMPSMYFPAEQVGWGTPHILLATSSPDPTSIIGPARQAISSVDPSLPVREPQLLEDVVSEAAGDQRFYAALFGAFACLALALGMIGVYGVMSYSVGQRRREVGVRVALGATNGDVLAGVLWRGLVPILTGTALGLVAALVASRFLASLLYQVETTDPWVYSTVALLILLSGVVAILVPASRAVRLDPARALHVD